MVWSLSAELGATEMAVAHRIADIVDGPDGRGVAGCIDVSYWDEAAESRAHGARRHRRHWAGIRNASHEPTSASVARKDRFLGGPRLIFPLGRTAMERRLAAILLTDIVGYSRLMGLDEEGTIAHQKAHRDDVIDPTITQHGGRIVKSTGDGLLVEFPSVVDAVKCAIEVQRELADRDADVPEDRRINTTLVSISETSSSMAKTFWEMASTLLLGWKH